MKLKVYLPILVMVIGLCIFSGKGFCEEIRLETGFTELKAAIFYDFNSEKTYAGGTIPIVSYKVLSLEAGVIGDSTETLPLLGLSVDAKKVAEYFGIDWQLLKYTSGGVFGARDFDDSNDAWMYGVYAGLAIPIGN